MLFKQLKFTIQTLTARALPVLMAGTLFCPFIAAQAGGFTEIFLPRYQAQQMLSDQPFTDVVVRTGPDEKKSGQSSELWFAGRTSLWRWQLADQSVRRYRLMDAATEDKKPGTQIPPAGRVLDKSRLKVHGLHRILVDSGTGSFYVASTDGLFEVDPGNGRILHYPLPEKATPETTGLYGVGDHIAWMTSADIIQLDRYGKRLHVSPLPQPLRVADRVLWSPMNKWFWFSRGQSLATFSLLKGGQETQMWLAPSQVSGLMADRNSLFAWTPSVVARFTDTENAAGKALDKIKVTSPRELNQMTVSGNNHAYLFTDGTLEIYVTDTQQRNAWSLPLPSGRDAGLISHLALGGPDGRSQVVVLVAGKPRVFSLAKDLSLSSGTDNLKADTPKGN